MLDRTPLHEEQAKKFTSLISRRIGLSMKSPLSPLPGPEDYNISNIDQISADIAIIKLYGAALIAKTNEEIKHIISGIVWLCNKTSDWMKFYLSIASLDLKDNIAITHTKLIKLDNYNFFYNVFLEHEIVTPILKIVENYNILKESSIPTENQSVAMKDLLESYRQLNMLSPELDVNTLLRRAKEAIILKHKFETLINLISSGERELKKSDASNYDKKPIIDIYRSSPPSSAKIDVSSIKEITEHDYDNFLINTSDITLAGRKNKGVRKDTVSLKRDVLNALKRSKHTKNY